MHIASGFALNTKTCALACDLRPDMRHFLEIVSVGCSASEGSLQAATIRGIGMSRLAKQTVRANSC